MGDPVSAESDLAMNFYLIDRRFQLPACRVDKWCHQLPVTQVGMMSDNEIQPGLSGRCWRESGGATWICLSDTSRRRPFRGSSLGALGVGKDGSDIWHQWSGHPVKLLGARWFGYMLASTLLEMATSFIQPSHGMISWCSTHFLCPSWWLQSRSSLIRKWCLWHLKAEGADQGGGALWSDLRKFSSTWYGDLWDPALFFFLRWGNWQHSCDVVDWYEDVEDCLF